MAQSGGDQSFWSAWPGGVLIAILVGLGIVVQAPFRPARPPEDKLGSASGTGIADARLWQDPFAAANAARKAKREIERDQHRQAVEENGAKVLTCLTNKLAGSSAQDPAQSLSACLAPSPGSSGASQPGEKKAADGSPSIGPLDGLRDKIGDRAKDKGKGKKNILVLGYMVSAGPSAGAAEVRRRVRYATLAGLMAEGFYPDDAEHIFYVSPNNDNFPSLIPYEWLKRDTGESVLVLWLDEDKLTAPSQKLDQVAAEPAPLARLSELLTAIRPNAPHVEFAVIGPADSSTLVAMAIEYGKPGVPCSPLHRLWVLDTAKLWSPSATIPQDKAPFPKPGMTCTAVDARLAISVPGIPTSVAAPHRTRTAGTCPLYPLSALINA